jgi:hypothetical protein
MRYSSNYPINLCLENKGLNFADFKGLISVDFPRGICYNYFSEENTVIEKFTLRVLIAYYRINSIIIG